MPQASQPSPPAQTATQLAQLIDHTLLRADASPAQLRNLCAEARQHRFFAVCVNPAWVPLAVTELTGSGVRVCTVVGFPLGAQAAEVKAFEARHALAQGAEELDVVLNLGALKAGDDAWVREDLGGVVAACVERGALCKVILETALLSEEEKRRACQLAVEAGAHFVKTSTGFAGGATAADVALLHQEVRAAGLGVKASGGIRTLADLRRMVAAGASRIGTSSGVAILAEAQAGGEASLNG